MAKKTTWIVIFFIILLSCNQKSGLSLEKQQKILDDMTVEASIIYSKLQSRQGKSYLEFHDKYYDVKIKRIKTAIDDTKKFTLENKTEDEIRRMAYIAEIAKNEQLVVDTIKEDFRRFPESKTVDEVVLQYFNNAYLLEPSEVEKYVNFKMFSPGDELYCYAMLALGFSENANIRQAEIYFEKMNSHLETIISNPAEKGHLPLLYIEGLRSYIAYKTGKKVEAYNILAKAEKEFSGEQEQNALALFRKRLDILGSDAPELESRYWIGTEDKLNWAALKGKVVLLNFFTWDCDECNDDVPFLTRLLKEIKSKDFLLIGVTNFTGHYEHTEGISEEAEYQYMKDHYYKKKKIQWPVNMSRKSMDNYGIYSAPTYVLIDKAGRVQAGYFIFNFTCLRNKIRSLLKKTG